MNNLQFQDFGSGLESVNSTNSEFSDFGDRSKLFDNGPPSEEFQASRRKPNYLCFEYYQQYFNVETTQVMSRILNGMIPTLRKNLIRDFIQPVPDFCGPFWICITLAFSNLILGNLEGYMEGSGGKLVVGISIVSSTAILLAVYVFLAPLGVFWGLWLMKAGMDFTYPDLLCAYGYSLAIFVPASILWVLPTMMWLKWLVVLITVVSSSTVLVGSIWSSLKRTPLLLLSAAMVACMVLVQIVVAVTFMRGLMSGSSVVTASGSGSSGHANIPMLNPPAGEHSNLPQQHNAAESQSQSQSKKAEFELGKAKVAESASKKDNVSGGAVSAKRAVPLNVQNGSDQNKAEKGAPPQGKIEDDSKRGERSNSERSNEDEEVAKTDESDISWNFKIDRKNLNRILSTFVVQDDDEPYATGVIEPTSIVILSYLQNSLMIPILLVRLPWIVGFIGYWKFIQAMFFDLFLVIISAFSIFAVTTNNSDRFYGGPFTLLLTNFGRDTAVLIAVFLYLANCGFVAANLMICSEAVTRYVSFTPIFTTEHAHNLLRNNLTLLKESGKLGSTRIYRDLYFVAFLIIPILYVSFGKKFIKFVFWIPSTFFGLSLCAVFLSLLQLKWNGAVDVRCMLGNDQLPTSLYRTLHDRPIETPAFDLSAMHNCDANVMERFLNCSPVNETCIQTHVWNQTIKWSFHFSESDIIQNAAKTQGLGYADWRNVIYHHRVFKWVRGGDMESSSILGCAAMLFPVLTGPVLGANIPSAIAAPTKIVGRGTLSAISFIFAFTIALGTTFAFGIDRALLLDKFGEASIRNLPIPLLAGYPIFTLICLLTLSATAAGQYMQVSKALLLSLITSRKFPVPHFFHDRNEHLRHFSAIGLVSITVCVYTRLNTVDNILIASASIMMVGLGIISLACAFCHVFELPTWQPTTIFFHMPIPLLATAMCWGTAYMAEPRVIGNLCPVMAVYFVVFNKYAHWSPCRMVYEIAMNVSNMFIFSIPLTEIQMRKELRHRPRCTVFTRFPAASDNLLRFVKLISHDRHSLCIPLVRHVFNEDDPGRNDYLAAQRNMAAMLMPGFASLFMYRRISSLHSIASALTKCSGLGAFHPNTVILEHMTKDTIWGIAEPILYHYHMHRVCVAQCNLMLVKGRFDLKMENLTKLHTIDVWWLIDSGDALILLANNLKGSEHWKNVSIRLFAVVETTDKGKQIEKDIRRWFMFSRQTVHYIEVIYVEAEYLYEYTFLRPEKIAERAREPSSNSTIGGFFGMLGLYHTTLLQSAVDRGHVPTEGDKITTIRKIPYKQLRVEQELRGDYLNDIIYARSSEAFLVIINIPEPPAKLERFWIYVSYLEKLTHDMDRAILFRGIDCQTSADKTD